jgi:CheY-like chemotaxis protein
MTDPSVVHPVTVALFNASDDTIEIVQALLNASGRPQVLVGCHFTDLKSGIVDLETFLARHDPVVVILDLSPPYDENWRFFVRMRESPAMRGRGIVLTTTNKNRLDEAVGGDANAIELVGRAKDLGEIDAAIAAETQRVLARREQR